MTNKERFIMWGKGAIALVILMLYAIGVVGGIGNLCYYHQYVPALGVLVTGVLAFPTVKRFFKKMSE